MVKRLLILILLMYGLQKVQAQVVTVCPQNIGFESGTFANWDSYSGEISGTGERFINAVRPPTVSLNFTGPFPGQHTMIGRTDRRDDYGNFH